MNNFQLAFRSLFKRKNLNVIKITSLAAALAVSLILMSKVLYENSFDTFYPDFKHIYVVGTNELLDSQPVEDELYFGTPGGVAVGIRDEIPGIESATRITSLYSGNLNVTAENQNIFRSEVIMADSCFFDVFSIPILSGNARQTLSSPMHVLISESTASLLKGDPIGQTLTFESLSDRQVTIGGIFKDLPSNSSIKYDIILSLESLPYFEWDGRLLWHGNDRYESFVKLSASAQFEDIQRALQALTKRHIPPEEYENKISEIEYYLYPLTQAYAYTHDVSRIIYIFSFLALAVLIAAVLNYMLFTTSTLIGRSKEFAIFKCCGVQPFSIITRLILETTINLFLVLILSVLIIYALKTPVENVLETSISILFSRSGIALLAAIFITLLLATGLIPALLFSRTPVVVAYRNSSVKGYKIWKKILLFTQLSITSLLLIMLVNTHWQYNRLINDNLGYTYDHLLYSLSLRSQPQSIYSTVINRLKTLPEVEGVSTGSFLLQARNSNIVLNHNTELFSFVDFGHVNMDFIPLFEIQLIEGIGFSDNSIKGDVMVSKSFANRLSNAMNWNDGVIGKMITATGHDGILRITGVFADINTGNAISPHIGPSMFAFNNDFNPVLMIKGNNIDRETRKTIIDLIQTSSSGKPVDLGSYKELMFSNYSKVSKFRDSLMSGFIATMIIVLSGLAGYIYNEITKRNQEVAIRKICGAELTGILKLFILDVLKIAVPAILSGGIIAWFIIGEWMKEFPLQERIPLWSYILCLLSVVILIFVTVIIICYRKAKLNPVMMLKS